MANSSRIRRATLWLAPFAIPLLLTFAVLGSVALPPTVKAATRTWDGGGPTTLWNDPLNWSANTLPVAGDTVIFDGTSSKNADINVAVTVAIMQVNAGYGGTITQMPGVNLSVTSSYSQSAGSFAGGTTAISIGSFTLNPGGTFGSTTATLTVTGAFTMSGGSFAHNNGSVAFSTGNVTIDVPTSISLNNTSFLSGTKTIAAGDTLNVAGTLNLAGGVVNTGTLAAMGNIDVQAGFTGNSTGVLLVSGSGAQTMTGNHAVGSGDLPGVVINKPSGALTLAGTLRTTDNWTYTAAPGGLNVAGSTVSFAGGTITGSHTLNNVEIRGGTITIAAGTTVTVGGGLNLFSGVVNTGTLAAMGNIDVQAGFTGNSTGVLLVSGSGAQTMTGNHAVGSGDLPGVVINKPSGALTLAGTLRTTDNWTYTAAPGGLNVAGSTVSFAGGTITGSHTLNNVEIRGGTITIAAGTTVTVGGGLNLFSGVVNTGTLAAMGNIDVQAGFTGNSTGVLLVSGSGAQTMTGNHAVGSGDLPGVVINKPSGALTLAGTLRTTDNWTYTAAPGGLNVAGSTVSFAGGTITGSHTLNNVEIRGGTITIAAGTTVTVGGGLNLFSGTMNTGTLAAQGSITAQVGFTGGGTATLLINGNGNQTFTGYHTVLVGALPNVDVNKPSGALTLAAPGPGTGILRTGRNWTVSSIPGGLTVTGSTVVFAGNLTITGSHTLNNVDVRGGTVVIAAGTTLTVAGTTELFSGTLNQAAATGTIAAQGDINARVGFTGGGTATLLINGSGNQLFDGDHTVTVGALPNVDVNKPAGSLTLTDTLRTARNWTVSAVPGGLTVTGSTVVFAGNLTITGSHTLNNVEFRAGVAVIAAGTTLTVAGTTTLTDGDLNGGTLEALGNLSQAATFDGETSTIRIAGMTNQTFTGSATSTTGDLPAIVIDKPSGTLFLVGTIRTTSVGWTWLQGAVDPGTSTVVFNTSTVTGGHTLHNVELQGGVVAIAAGDTLTVAGTTTLTDGDLNGGTLEALGNVTLLGTFDGETGTLRIGGAGDQTLTGSATSTTGDMASIVIDKPAGTLFLAGTIRLTTAAWTWVAGAVDAGTSVLVLDTGTTIAGTHTVHDLILRGGAHTVGSGLPTAGGLLTLEDGTIDGGTLGAAGDITQAAAFDGGSGTLVVTGAANQTFTGAATIGTGDLPDVDIAKSGGTLTLAGTIRLSDADWTHITGAVIPGTSLVVFSGTSTVSAAGMSFFDLTVNGGTTTLGDDLFVGGDLTVLAGTLDGSGQTASVAGDVTVDGAIAADTLSLRMNGLAPQNLGGAAADIGLVDLVVDNAAGVTQATTVMVSGTLTLNGPLDFSGETLGIANPIAGTPASLVGDAASSLEVFGTGTGIVIPAGLSALANLTLDNPNGASLAGPMTIGQGLVLTDGIIEVRPWVLTVGPAGVVTRAAGHVDGSLEKTVPLGSAVTVDFEIGDATTYAPVNVSFGMVLWSSTLTAVTVGGEHPNLATSVIRPTADVNRWWRVTNNGVLFDSADVTLHWSPSDVDPGADPATFVVGKFDAGWTMPAVSNPTPTAITANGLTSFSSFAVGGLEDGDLPDTSGDDDPGTSALDLGLRASVVSAVLLGLVGIVIVLTRRGRPEPRAARDDG